MDVQDRPAPPPQLTRAQLAAVVAGNGLEFYDFLTYSFFAAQIGRALFPTAGGNSLLWALATFWVGFVTRPLGALVIGRIADRRGRKPAMLLSFACMGAALIGLAVTPAYATIGMLAPALAVLCRMMQGFALGGEVGTNTAFLLEAAPPGRRGLYVSFQYATQGIAIAASGTMGFLLSSHLSAGQLDAWGWRAAFLIGAVIVPFGLVARRTLGETLVAHRAAPASAAERRQFRRAIAGGLLMLAAGTIGGYTLDYLTTYAQTTLGMKVTVAFSATIVLGLSATITDIVAGLLTDRFGRKRVLIAPWVLLILLSVPAFLVMGQYRSATALLGMTALLSVLQELVAVPSLLLFTEALPQRIRAGSMGLTYALSISMFGGSAQFVDQALIQWTGSALAPAWYMAVAFAVGLVGVALIRERRPPPRIVRAAAVALDPAL